jgi:CheY-like chemotaxis protein
MRILVVEDDAAIRESVEECLAAEGHSTASVGNGAEALEWLAREPLPDVLVVDLVMPVMNGADLIQRVRADPRLAAVPIVLMTAAMSAPELQIPADSVLPKPFDLDALLAAVERHGRGTR